MLKRIWGLVILISSLCLYTAVSEESVADAAEAGKSSNKKTDLEWDDLGLSAEFYFETDQDRVMEEYYEIGAKLEFEFDAPRHWKMQLELEAAMDGLDLEEVWGRWKGEDYKIKAGLFKNEILLEDQLSDPYECFINDNLIKERMDQNGWYSKSSTGVKIYEDVNYAHLLFQPTGREMQAIAGWYYPFAGEDSYLGASFVYYNYFVHNLWVGGEGFTNDNNFLLSTAVADLSLKKLPFFYKVEVTGGNNLIDPIGFVHFPSEGDVNWFLGGDLLVGLPRGDEDFLWTPALNLSIIMQDIIEYPEAWTSYVRMGHQLAWDETFYIRLEAGLEIDTYYDTYEHADPTLVTGLEALWGISVEVEL